MNPATGYILRRRVLPPVLLVAAVAALMVAIRSRRPESVPAPDARTIAVPDNAAKGFDLEKYIEEVRDWSPEKGFDLDRHIEALKIVGGVYHARRDEAQALTLDLGAYEERERAGTPERAAIAGEIDALEDEIDARRTALRGIIEADEEWRRLSGALAEAVDEVERRRLSLNDALLALNAARRARLRYEVTARADTPERALAAARLDALIERRESEADALRDMIAGDPEWRRLETERAAVAGKIEALEAAGLDGDDEALKAWRLLWDERREIEVRLDAYEKAARLATPDRLPRVDAIAALDGEIHDARNELQGLFEGDAQWEHLEAARLGAAEDAEEVAAGMREAAGTARGLRAEIARIETRLAADQPQAVEIGREIAALEERVTEQKAALRQMFEDDPEWRRRNELRLAATARRDEERAKTLELIRTRMQVQNEIARAKRAEAERMDGTDG